MDRIDIKTIRNFVNKLFIALESENITNVKIEKDYYWDVENEEKYNWENKPHKLSVGQITDDYESISDSLLKDKVISTNDFNRLSELLRYIGQYR